LGILVNVTHLLPVVSAVSILAPRVMRRPLNRPRPLVGHFKKHLAKLWVIALFGKPSALVCVLLVVFDYCRHQNPLPSTCEEFATHQSGVRTRLSQPTLSVFSKAVHACVMPDLSAVRPRAAPQFVDLPPRQHWIRSSQVGAPHCPQLGTPARPAQPAVPPDIAGRGTLSVALGWRVLGARRGPDIAAKPPDPPPHTPCLKHCNTVAER
jgi:hypothetical protein